MVRMLLDTCALSELQRPIPDPGVVAHINSTAADDLYLSVITLGEVAKGIALLAEGQRKRDLASWLEGLERQFERQILPIDRETARIWGEITARAQSNGVQIPASDGLIAATGVRHGLHIMTRNTRHFEATGALVIDPWRSSSTPDRWGF